MIHPDNHHAAVDISPETDYRSSYDYWIRQGTEYPEMMGVSAIGGCGLTEVLYRHFEEVRHLRSIVYFDPQKTVLELGSGNGRWAISLSQLVDRYVAVDFSEQMLDLARSRAKKLKLNNITFCRAALQDYTPPIFFDIIYLSGVSQYLHDADLKSLLTRLSGALRPGGVLIDRSTIHLHQRLLTENKDYFCIYRTAVELERIFDHEGFMLQYRGPSYRFLNVPGAVGRFLSSRQIARMVSFTAPLSFHLLRALAGVSNRLWGPTGEMVDFSHDFFIFSRRA